ncbi:TOMM precursor leader peptide-binding protein [Psychromarinibacter sp. C21-152]|uniref:TOMM leader peptide-binding protein n=1 Tax=Psychromarinibacter sediminicola TaxID=3033385 RepID=A0AAE3TA73_9RHOB|nr:TOMM precursor leader peptide-binding protein [Psychromarinibacter sediminicola]MDF0602558.1 TOMM precursor leader peptide-binding protein [Psychromarinibacter sediminicola]
MHGNLNKRIKASFLVVPHGPDAVELRSGIWNPVSYLLEDSAGSGQLYTLLRQLDGTASPAEIAKRNGVSRAEVEGLIDHLTGLGAIETGAATAMDFYAETMIPSLSMSPSAEADPRPVHLLGDAELTSEIARCLAPMPPGDPAQTALVERLTALLDGSDFGWLEDGLRLSETVAPFAPLKDSLLVEAAAVVHPLRARALNRICLAHGIPWMHVAVDGPFLLIGPLFDAQAGGACYECLETRIMMNMRERESYLRYKRALAQGDVGTGPAPLVTAVQAVLASYAALELLNFRLTGNGFTKGKVMSVYLPTMEIAFNEVLPLSGCPACGSSPERDDTQLYFDMRALLAEAE